MKRDNPFVDNPALVKADEVLKRTYQELLTKLNFTDRSKLIHEQRAWLAGRDYATTLDRESTLTSSVIAFRSDQLSPVPDIGLESDEYEAFDRSRDASLIKSTQERTKELKKRLTKVDKL